MSYKANTSLLLHFDGSAGSSVVHDSSWHEHAASWAGSGVLASAQSKFGDTSGYFTTNDDAITYPADESLVFGADDFTIEVWLRFESMTDVEILWSGSDPIMRFRYDESDDKLQLSTTGDDTIESSVLSWGIDTWYHAAGCRVVTPSVPSSNLDIFADGSLVANDDHAIVIGSGQVTNPGGAFRGWMDELRILKGVAAYTEEFTPETAPFDMSRDMVAARFI